MPDDAAKLLPRAGKEAGHVFKRQKRDIERVAEAHEARAFDRGVDIEASCQVRRLIGDDADRAPVHAREPDHEVPREVLVHFEELAVIDYAVDDVLDVVRQVRFGRHERIKRGIHTVDRIGAGAAWRLVAIILRQVAQQLANHAQAGGVVGGDEVAHAADRVVRHRAAQPLLGHVFVRHGLDDVRSGDEHVAGVVDHEDEVGDGRRVHRTARAGTHDGGYLRRHAAGECVAQEDIGVAGQ